MRASHLASRTYDANALHKVVPLYRACGIERPLCDSEPQMTSSKHLERIAELEEELLQYRNMVEKLVQQRTSLLSRRIALLRSCNAKVYEEFDRMREKYLDLLCRIQSAGADAQVCAVLPERTWQSGSHVLLEGYRLRPLSESTIGQAGGKLASAAGSIRERSPDTV